MGPGFSSKLWCQSCSVMLSFNFAFWIHQLLKDGVLHHLHVTVLQKNCLVFNHVFWSACHIFMESLWKLLSTRQADWGLCHWEKSSGEWQAMVLQWGSRDSSFQRLKRARVTTKAERRIFFVSLSSFHFLGWNKLQRSLSLVFISCPCTVSVFISLWNYYKNNQAVLAVLMALFHRRGWKVGGSH